ncbi:phage major capsid protein [Paenibacillus lactis]|uniref:phage major capsid protein n=1 Tax=Paenibacillus lactis TaxID=228574 RepID=UPI00203CCA64|nr:phage major capsid protein [Paenibacillus lactis]MCM3492851.1 phage major capsid protein [Paenibacillus lactis]
MNRLQEIQARLTEIRNAIDNASEAEVTAFETEIRDLNKEKELIEKREALKNGIPTGAQNFENPNHSPEERSEVEDITTTIEYRKAFMEFAKTGKRSELLEKRANEVTTTNDAAAVVPTTILDEMIRKMTVYGQIFSRIRKLNVKGGVAVPILSLKPVATWIGETTPSDRQKVQSNSSVTFNYHGLECKVAISLLAETVTLASFESTIVELIVEAMTKALDIAVIKGTGSGQPLGITADTRIPAANIVDLTEDEIKSWAAWKKEVFAKIPLAYRAGGSFIMAAGTFETYIDGMTDANGQPIGRVDHGITEGPQERFSGREVILVEDDVIAPYDAAAAGDVIAVFCKLTDYAINSNMQLQMFRWLDHDTNQWVDKAILIADGKILDPNGVIIIKRAATTP